MIKYPMLCFNAEETPHNLAIKTFYQFVHQDQELIQSNMSKIKYSKVILIGLYLQLIFILLLKENALDMFLGWLFLSPNNEWTLSCAEGGKSPLEFKEKHVGLKFGQFLSSYLFCVCNCIRKEKSSLYEKT